MKSTQSTFLVDAQDAIPVEAAAKALGLSVRYLHRKDTRNRLGLFLVRNRISLDDRRIWLSKESVIKAIAGLGRNHA